MEIAIVGAGFTGLSASYRLSKLGHKITIFEKESLPGGLALGFKHPEWEWSLEEHYHHWFTNDKNALLLAKEVGHEIITKRPKTSVYVDNKIYQLDSPLKILTFPPLNILERLRMAMAVALLRFNPFWKPLEKIKAVRFLKFTMGERAYKKVWEPQLKNKFSDYFKDISLTWFWARIVKRTPSLVYPKGGFLNFAKTIMQRAISNNGTFLFGTEVTKVDSNQDGRIGMHYKNSNQKTKILKFDRVIVTLPSFAFIKIVPALPKSYQYKLGTLRGLGALNLILRLKEKFLKDNTYWLSVCDTTSPITAIVEHTNFIENKYYNNEHIVYLGKYLPPNHPYMKMSKHELLKSYDPFLKKINPNYQLSIINYQLFKAPFAQPIIPIHYSKIIPSFETPIKNLYLANIEQVYPWDRGTNYAIELGEKIAALITK